MALTKLNNRSISAVTSLPSASTSSFLTGVSASDLPTGTVIQTAINRLTTSVEGTADFDILSVQITPYLPDSNIIITASLQWSVLTNDGDDWMIQLYRDSTIILGEDQRNAFISGGGVDTYDFHGQGGSVYGVNQMAKTDIDIGRPSSTNTITYKLRKASPWSTKNVRFMRDGWGGPGNESNRANCTLIAQEIKG